MAEMERLQMVGSPLYGRLWFLVSEVIGSKNDVDVLMCGSNSAGRKLFDRKTAKALVGQVKGVWFIDQMRRLASALSPEEKTEPKKDKTGRK